MQTRCPACETVFHLTETQVQAASALVQCGICKHYFNALQSQITDPLSDQLTGKSRELATNNLLASLRNAYRQPRPPRGRWLTVMWSGLVLLSLFLGLAQLAWFNLDRLLGVPELKPSIERLCLQLPCQLKPEVDLEQIEMLSRDVRAHPSHENALLITATFINHAKFTQPYPQVHLELYNRLGDVVAQRTFTAKEYLAEEKTAKELMERDVPVTIIMEVVDPGEEAISYRFEFT